MNVMDNFRILMLSALLLLGILSIEDAYPKVDCNEHPIFCQIKKNRPRLDNKYAMKLSNIVYKVSREYSVPTRIFVGILMQESRYSLEARGCHSGLVKGVISFDEPVPVQLYNESLSDKEKEIYFHRYVKEVDVCSDFGIGQIYFKTARRFKLDVHKLITDLEYSVVASAKVLADFQKRYSAKEVDWWTRYNSRSKTKRQIYKKLVERYL